MAVASGVSVEIAAGSVRLLPGAAEYARAGAIPGGQKNNREFASCAVEYAAAPAREVDDLLYDPQTSGGLLISLPDEDARQLERVLEGAYRIGRVTKKGEKPIRIV
jgi:selenide,water dikinase